MNSMRFYKIVFVHQNLIKQFTIILLSVILINIMVEYGLSRK